LEAALQGVEPTEEELTFVMKMAGGRAVVGWSSACEHGGMGMERTEDTEFHSTTEQT